MMLSNSHRTYLVSKSIIPYYFTQLIGDAKNPPTLLAAATFNDIAVIGESSPHASSQQRLTRDHQTLIHTFLVDMARSIG